MSDRHTCSWQPAVKACMSPAYPAAASDVHSKKPGNSAGVSAILASSLLRTHGVHPTHIHRHRYGSNALP